MGFLKSLIEPYKKVYNEEEYIAYGDVFAQAYYYAMAKFADRFDTDAKRLYAVFYASLYGYLKDRPYQKGELCFQVAKSIEKARELANIMHVNYNTELLLYNAIVQGYATILIMRTQNVSPGHAAGMRLFRDCSSYLMQLESPTLQILAKLRENIEALSAIKDILPCGKFLGYRWDDTMSMIGDDNF